jgi:pimeloyl-ACP methyl ester carboxylesterase
MRVEAALEERVIEDRFVDVGTARIAVRLAGETARGIATKPLALFVHGYPLSSQMWLAAMHSALEQHRTLCAIDLRGHGRSPWALEEMHSMELFADDLAMVARTLSDDPVDVVALSMGGYAALAMCERHPAAIRSLALVDTKATADTDAAKEGRKAMAKGVLEHGRSWLRAQMLPKLVADAASPSVRAQLTSMIESTPVETILADLAGMAQRPDRTHVLGSVSFPVLAVVGALDALTPVSDAEAICRAAKARGSLAVIEGSGHMAPMERPAEFAHAMLAFWQSKPAN